jgi:sigma-E factor negative regulatory protein RseA
MSDTPDHVQREQLSALLDGELSAKEHDALVTRLADSPQLRRHLARYQLIQAQLQTDSAQLVDASLVSDRVRERLRSEPTVLMPRATRHTFHLPRVALGAALAAGVAVVTLSVAPRLLENPVEAASPQTFAFSPRLSVPSVDATTVALGGPGNSMASGIPASGQRWKVLQPELRRKLDSYLLEHNEFAGRLGVAHPSVHVGFVSTQDAQR